MRELRANRTHAQAQQVAVRALTDLITGSGADRLSDFALHAGVLRVGLLQSDISVS